MGQKNSEHLKKQGIELNSWVQAIEDPNHTLFANVNPFRRRMLVNKNTKELIQEYQLQFLNQQDFNSYSRDIDLRKEQIHKKKIGVFSNQQTQPYKTSPYIYKVKYFTNTSVTQLCSTIYNGLLYIDKVDLRLRQINDIPFSDQLYLYQCCLEGFKILYEKVGYFDITEQMIFFNQQGKVKVWMNPNLSKHHPNYQPDINATNMNTISIQVQGSQSQMLKNLINLIEDNTDQISQQNPIHFRQYLTGKGIFDRLSFYKAIDEYHQYIESYNLHVSNYMKSIYDLFHHDKQQHDQLYQSQNSSASRGKVVQTGKDYESSMKNSSHQMSFQKLNQSSHNRLAPVRFTQASPLQASRSSKNSYNSDYHTMKITQITPQNRLTNSKLNHYIVGNQYSHNTITVNKKPNQQTNLTIFNTLNNNESKRQIVTFCPPQNKILKNEPSITKYRSLQKHQAFIPVQNRPITFSYQSNLNHQSRHSISETNKSQRKQSIIDKLNVGVNIVNTQATKESNQSLKLSQNVNKILLPKKINYFSTSQSFVLDKQIADDMIKYLGFNPNLI